MCNHYREMPRKYEMKKRAESVEETRRRIVEAAVELHGTIGPARTTLSEIAKRAGVERQTYYRHFPAERDLHLACSGLYMERNPLPDPARWRAIEDPEERLRHGVAEMYAFYDANEAMFANVIRDSEVHELTREVVTIRLSAVGEMVEVLTDGWRGKDGERVRPVLSLALSFHTWRSLVREGELSSKAAVDTIVAMVGGALA